MPDIDLLFPSTIYKVEDLISDNYKNELVDECYRLKSNIPDQSYKWNCEIYTTYGDDLQNQNKFSLLIKHITDQVHAFAGNLGCSARYNIDGAWINISSAGNWQEHHNHPNSIFSAVYYLKAPGNSGDLVFENPRGYANNLKDVKEPNFYTMDQVNYPPKENGLIIFRSYMQHMVKINKSTKDRISVAINYS
jgi:uncharacterized protein (TIGR02466 family)